jgi:glycosyltransferase involved in cell wall biosynthesis
LLTSRDLGGGGSQRQLAEVARRLDRSLFSPHVGCFFPNGLRLEELSQASVPVAEFPVRSFKSPSAFRVAAQFGRYLRQNNIALVHSFDVPMNLFSVSAARWYKAPIVLSSMRASRSLTPGIYHRWLRLTDRMVDAIVVNSNAVRNELIQQDNVPSSLIHLCYNSLDTEHFHSRRPPRIPALAGASLVIGSTAMFRPEKGLANLVEAFAETCRDRPDHRLLLVGDGPLREDLEALANRLGIGSQCHFPGAHPDVAEWLRQMDIFVLPSLSEALSNSLLEAMSCGCTVVASRTGGNPELVRQTPAGETGLLFETAQTASLAAQLRRLIEDPALRSSLSAAAQSFVQSTFTPDQTIRNFQQLYLNLLRAKGLLPAA